MLAVLNVPIRLLLFTPLFGYVLPFLLGAFGYQWQGGILSSFVLAAFVMATSVLFSPMTKGLLAIVGITYGASPKRFFLFGFALSVLYTAGILALAAWLLPAYLAVGGVTGALLAGFGYNLVLAIILQVLPSDSCGCGPKQDS